LKIYKPSHQLISVPTSEVILTMLLLMWLLLLPSLHLAAGHVFIDSQCPLESVYPAVLSAIQRAETAVAALDLPPTNWAPELTELIQFFTGGDAAKLQEMSSM
jgi:hypothetical protein